MLTVLSAGGGWDTAFALRHPLVGSRVSPNSERAQNQLPNKTEFRSLAACECSIEREV